MQPVIFSSNFFELHTLWIFFAIAIVVTSIVIIRLGIKNGLKIQFISDNAWKIVIFGLLGARIMAIAGNYSSYFYEFSGEALLRLLYIWDKGLELWGGIVVATIYFYFLCKKSDQSFWKWLDVLVPATIMGLAIGDLGAFFDGTNYGTPSSLPWSVNFENPAVKFSVPIHPTQIYAFLYSTLIFVGLRLLPEHKKIKEIEQPGFIALLGIGSYGFFHFLEEFIRGDDTITLLGIRLGQIGAAITIIGSIVVIYRRYFKKSSSLHSKSI